MHAVNKPHLQAVRLYFRTATSQEVWLFVAGVVSSLPPTQWVSNCIGLACPGPRPVWLISFAGNGRMVYHHGEFLANPFTCILAVSGYTSETKDHFHTNFFQSIATNTESPPDVWNSCKYGSASCSSANFHSSNRTHPAHQQHAGPSLSILVCSNM